MKIFGTITIAAIALSCIIFKVEAVDQCYLCYGKCEEQTVITCEDYFPGADATVCLTMKIDDLNFVNKGCLVLEDAAIICGAHNLKYGEGACTACEDNLCNE